MNKVVFTPFNIRLFPTCLRLANVAYTQKDSEDVEKTIFELPLKAL